MYYLSIGYLMNSRPMNYNPWSYMIYVGQGYLVKHIVSTKLAIVIAHLSLYSSISNHPVTGSIKVTALILKFYLFSFHLLYLHRFYSMVFTQIP